MTKYVKKPIVIEAWQYGSKEEMPNWLCDAIRLDRNVSLSSKDNCLYIKTLEGTMKAENGDYIIRGIQGELYPCKPDIFEATYNLYV